MTPVEVLRLRPAGRAGDTENDATAPPPHVGVLGLMATPTVYVAGFVEYVRLLGALTPLHPAAIATRRNRTNGPGAASNRLALTMRHTPQPVKSAMSDPQRKRQVEKT